MSEEDFALDMNQLIACRFVQGLASAPKSWSLFDH